MNQSADTSAPKNSIQTFINKFNPRYFNFEQKIRVLLIFITLISIIIIASIGFYVSKVDARNFTINHLRSIQEAKRQYLDDYFNQVSRNISMLANDEAVINSTIAYKNAFQEIENDNYLPEDVENIDVLEEELKSYYETEYVQKVNKSLQQDFDIESLYPENVKSRILQYLYIVKNKNTRDQKHLFDRAPDNSQYSSVHADFHPEMRKLAAHFGFEDMYLIDHISGHVVYSLKKDFSYGADLMMGSYKNTGLARIFKDAMVGSKNYVQLSDYQLHLPSLGEPSMFVATPIYQRSSQLGVLVCKISNKRIHNILTSGNNWEREGLGKTGQLSIVGDDMKLRSKSRDLIENKEQYLKALQKAGVDNHTMRMIENLDTDILLHEVELQVVKKALKGESLADVEKDFADKKVIVKAAPLQVDDLNWAIVGQIDLEETYASFRELRTIIILASILFILLSVYMGHHIARRFSSRIISIRDALIALSKGESIKKIKDHNNDEIRETVDALRSLSDRIDYASEFAQAMGGGNFNAYFEPQSDSDKFGHSLTQMKDSLVKAKEEEEKRKVEDEIRNWITNGIAKFSEILRKNNDDIDQLSYNIIKEMVNYLEANIAGMYLLNDDDPNDPVYELKASYAYDRKKYLDIQFKPGEGLVGTCAKEGQSIFLKEIPEDYIEITSGFGHASPRSLFLVPLKVEDTVYGIIEIGSLQVFKEHHIEFIERLAESVAATLITVRLNIKTQKLLKESEERTNEIKQQEEEMRQNMEEMSATQEELERVRKDEEQKVAELTKTVEASEQMILRLMNKIPGNMLIKNPEGIIIYANENAAEQAFVSVDELIGKTGHEHLTKIEAEQMKKAEKQIMLGDKDEISFTVQGKDKKKQYIRIIKGPLAIDDEDSMGLLIWEMEYTELRKYGEKEARQELGEFKEKMKDTMKELRKYRDKYGDIE